MNDINKMACFAAVTMTYLSCMLLVDNTDTEAAQMTDKNVGYTQTELTEYLSKTYVSKPTSVTTKPERKDILTDEEVELIALVTVAEAEGESEEGLRLVIDSILNRVDSEYFPDTVYDVVYQPKHYTVMWNGRAERCSVDDDICELVREEAEDRTDSDVIFFREDRYSDYGVPMFKVGCHYFSSYD